MMHAPGEHIVIQFDIGIFKSFLTTILEGGTKDEMRISKEALFNGLWPKFMLPKRRFWKVGQTFQSAFSKHFSRV
jgi:hypothetical protein